MKAPRLACPHCRAVFQPDSAAIQDVLLCPRCSKRLRLPASVRNRPQSADALLGGEGAAGRPEQTGDIPDTQKLRPEESSDIFAEKPGQQVRVEEVAGPLSLKGIQARPRVSLTWGDFQVLRKLGAGNMGAVYLARQKSMDREVALKVLFRHLAMKPQFVERFYREAEAMCRLDHPGLVRCHGIGEVKGCPYFAMDFIQGFSAGAVREQLGGTYAIGDALYIVIRCAEALAHAHERKVIHRDVKPENILLTHLGYVKLTDLGLAKPIDEDLSLTDTGVSLGTPYFMAPEQARDAKHADCRNDIYALGVVLYQFLTGRLPFQEDGLMRLLQAKERGIFPAAHKVNRDIPEYLSMIVDKMLARDPARRYPSCAEVVRALGATGLAHDHLGFNLLRVCKVLKAQDGPPPDMPRVEVLLIDDKREDVRRAQEALDQTGIFSNLTVLTDGSEALALLQKQGKYQAAPRPDLVIIGLDLGRKDVRKILMEFGKDEELRGVPLVILSWCAASAASYLNTHGLRASLNITHGSDLKQFGELLRSVRDLCVTVVEREPGD